MNNKREKIVTIRINTDNGKKVHKSLISNISRSFGPFFDRRTGRIGSGLSREEKEMFLPEIIGVTANDTQFNSKCDEYFKTINIKVDPVVGQPLNIATYKRTINFRGKEIEVDYPESLVDYIKYKQALANTNLMGLSLDQAVGEQLSFYLEDNTKVRETKEKLLEINDLIDKCYVTLVEEEDGKFKRDNKVNALLRIFNYNPQIMDIFEKKEAIGVLRDEDKKLAKETLKQSDLRFVKEVRDPKLEDKGLIYSCLSNEILMYQGDYIVDAEDDSRIIGRDIDSAVNWFKDQANSSFVIKYKKINEQRNEKILV